MDQILVDEVAQPLRMQGQYWDEEIGLCYNRYRYFDPQICAFISQDPLGLAAGENVYAYAPNVWGWVDPLGLACEATQISNPFPDNDTFARVMPARYAEAFASGKGNIGGGSEVFVTAADDLSGITTKSGAQQKLSLFTDYEGRTPNLSGDALVTFKVRDVNQVGLRSPIETNPARGYGFVYGGKTAGEAREWLFNNGTASELGIYDIKITPLR